MSIVEFTLLAVHGLIVPDLTGAEHGVDGTSEAAGSGDPGHRPTKTFAGLFIGPREPAVWGVGDVDDHGADEGPSEPTVGSSRN